MSKSDDLISRQAAIELAMQYCPDDDGTCSKAGEDMRNLLDELEELPHAQSDLTYIIFETLAECGIYGEEATVKFIGTLKRLGRSDLLPPCVR